MTKEEQRIAIAEFCGWTQIREAKLTGGLVGMPPNGEFEDRGTVPDYPNDLNAMHEAEKRLGKSTFDYARWLWKTSHEPPHHILTNDDMFPFAHATAHQRAEALLRTIGKWTETQDLRRSSA